MCSHDAGLRGGSVTILTQNLRVVSPAVDEMDLAR